MYLLIRSTAELGGTAWVNDPSSSAHWKKKMRRLFLLCIILFCTDDRCSMPLQTCLQMQLRVKRVYATLTTTKPQVSVFLLTL